MEVGGTYYYIVTAISISGESDNSAVVIGSVTGLPAPTGLTATVVSASQANLSWTASAGATSYMIRRSFNIGGPYTTIATSVIGTTFSDTTVQSGPTYHYVVAAVSATNGSANSAEATASIPLPTPWITQDIGSLGSAGYTIYTGGIFQVTGSASTNSSDGFQFAYQNLAGDSFIIARVDSQSTYTGSGGIMFRNSTSATSRFVSIVATSDSSDHIFLNYRSSDGGSSSYRTGYQAVPVWLKLTRIGNVFTGFYSVDGVSWTQVGSQTVNMNSSIPGGFTSNSMSTDTTATTVFSNVTVDSGNSAPTVVTPASASPSTVTGTITSLSVLGADDGGETNLTYTWTTTGTPPAPVAFSINGTNAAKNTVANFSAAGNYAFLVTITDQGGKSVTSSVNVTVNSTFTNIFTNNDDIGSPLPSPSGSSTYSTGAYTVIGGGADIWGTSDQFQYIYKAVTGDVTIIARVASVQVVDPWSKAGVMIRETTGATSTNAYLAVTPGNGITFQRRIATGEPPCPAKMRALSPLTG